MTTPSLRDLGPVDARLGHPSDHLANERTFLAWVRTALGLIGLGFVLARMGLFLRQLETISQPHRPPITPHGVHEFLVAGVLFLLLGTVLGASAGWMYESNRRALDEGRYVPARRRVVILTTMITLGGLAIAVLVAWRVLASE
jgi:putative membrane protein